MLSNETLGLADAHKGSIQDQKESVGRSWEIFIQSDYGQGSPTQVATQTATKAAGSFSKLAEACYEVGFFLGRWRGPEEATKEDGE